MFRRIAANTAWLMLAALSIALCGPVAQAADWPQFQGNAQHTGYTADSVAPSYRPRWIWCGNNKTLKNHASNASWPDDLTSRDGYNLPLPSSVNMTLCTGNQAVTSGTRVFIGDQGGQVYGISFDDGSTLWTGACPAAPAWPAQSPVPPWSSPPSAAMSAAMTLPATAPPCGRSKPAGRSPPPRWSSTARSSWPTTAAWSPPLTPAPGPWPGPSSSRPPCWAASPPPAPSCTCRPRT